MKGRQAKKTISFRLDPYIIDRLGQAAKEDNIALNGLVDQIFDNYVYWERRAAKIGWILIKNDVMKLFLDDVNDRSLTRIAKNAARTVMRDTMLPISARVDLKTWLFVTKYRSIKSNFIYQEIHGEGQMKVVITHNMGAKWSLFHRVYYKEMLDELGIKSGIEMTPNTLAIKIEGHGSYLT